MVSGTGCEAGHGQASRSRAARTSGGRAAWTRAFRHCPAPAPLCMENPCRESNCSGEYQRALVYPHTPPRRAGLRVISDCHFAVQLNHFIPGFLSYSVPVFSNVTIG
jgi:hypothetical protein